MKSAAPNTTKKKYNMGFGALFIHNFLILWQAVWTGFAEFTGLIYEHCESF
jgi:hypothetical protein